MADKSAQLILDALNRAALHPEGVPLHGNKSAPGLFPATAAGKQAAQRCKDEGLLRVVATEARGKTACEMCTVTDKGLAHLLSECSPKHVLEDFVRSLEGRQTQLNELIAAVRQMHLGMEALRMVTQKVLGSLNATMPSVTTNGHASSNSCRDAVLQQLTRWQSAGASEDCPLPALYRQAAQACRGLTVGQFHDVLRELHQQGRIYLHPWTGPLYDIPEPACALLVGHEVLYYASLRQPQGNGELVGSGAAHEPMPSYEYRASE
jgi:hypothetical protein